VSSSEDPSAVLNPDLYRQLTLSVEHADGSVVPIGEGGVILRAGANLSLMVSADEDEIELAVAQETTSVNRYFQQKYESLQLLTDANDVGSPIFGPFPDPETGVTPVGPAWSFTRASLWFGTINDKPADLVTGAFFLAVGPCGVVGSFPYANNGHPETEDALLRVFDVCAPCVDCPTWRRLDEYIRRLVAFYDYLFELIYNEDTTNPPVHPDGGVREAFNGLLRQYMTATRYWDYLVHNAAVKLAAQAQGQAVVTAVFYRNITPNPVSGVHIQLEFCFYKNGSPWSAIDAAVSSFKLLARSEADLNAIYDGVPVYGSSCVTVTLQAPSALASGKSLYGDLVLLLDNTIDLAENTSDEYHILLTATFTNTHLGTIVKEELIYFMPLLGSSL
jgi:hypothetical protein